MTIERTENCDRCGNALVHVFHDGNQPDNGCEFFLRGGYGMFFDSIPEEDDGEPVEFALTLCHDCTLEFFRSVPKLKNLKGLHSVATSDPSYPLCCEFSWTVFDPEWSDERKKKVLDMSCQCDENPRVFFGKREE